MNPFMNSFACILLHQYIHIAYIYIFMYASELWGPHFVNLSCCFIKRDSKESKKRKSQARVEHPVRKTQTHETCIITIITQQAIHKHTHESYVLATYFETEGTTVCNTIWKSYFRTLPIHIYIYYGIFYLGEERLLRFLVLGKDGIFVTRIMTWRTSCIL